MPTFLENHNDTEENTQVIHSFTNLPSHIIQVIQIHVYWYAPLHRIALLNPNASAVPELRFSTILCFNFFKTAKRYDIVLDTR